MGDDSVMVLMEATEGKGERERLCGMRSTRSSDSICFLWV